MAKTELDSIKGWFAGRLPDGWFEGVEVTLEDDQIVVVGQLPEVPLSGEATEEARTGAAQGRIARFREQTRGERIGIAREAEEKFEKHVTWGARLGEITKRFTPGGSGWSGGGGGHGRRVMIGHWQAWARRNRRSRAQSF